MTKIFISYVLGDDAEFMPRLHADLIQAWFEVWWDRESIALIPCLIEPVDSLQVEPSEENIESHRNWVRRVQKRNRRKEQSRGPRRAVRIKSPL
jgi:hypothetical protein